jgi:uncharacterized protein YbjT (DUF2867 family)
LLVIPAINRKAPPFERNLQMEKEAKTILVFGATGQQGGAVASALLRDGWHVRAFAKQTDTSPPVGLKGAEMAWGDLADARSIRAALDKVYGVLYRAAEFGDGSADDGR